MAKFKVGDMVIYNGPNHSHNKDRVIVEVNPDMTHYDYRVKNLRNGLFGLVHEHELEAMPEPEPYKFQIGDTVEVNNSSIRYDHIAKRGKVVRYHDSGVRVDFGDHVCTFFAKSLTLVETASKPLSDSELDNLTDTIEKLTNELREAKKRITELQLEADQRAADKLTSHWRHQEVLIENDRLKKENQLLTDTALRRLQVINDLQVKLGRIELKANNIISLVNDLKS